MSDLGLVPDTPELKNAWPELQTLGKRLAGILPDSDVTMPVLVSGDWGAGKTTLLRVIEHELRERACHPVVFEAWRYEAEGPLLPALVRVVWSHLPPSVRADAEHKKLWAELWQDTVTAAASMGPSLAQLVAGPLGGTLMNGLVGVLKRRQGGQAPDAAGGLESSITERLWDKLHLAVGTLPSDATPLVVLIDDLDRCSPSGAVALLDAIRMLIVQAPRGASQAKLAGSDERPLDLHFVVALDRTVLTQAVARKYHDISRFEGNRYLEKIFPLTFDLPRPDESAIRELVERSLTQSHLALRDVCAGALSKPIFANPRLVKRCINRLKLLRHFEKAKGEIGSAEYRELVVLVEWLAATERWPSLRRLLSRRPQEYWHKVRAVLRHGESSESLEHAVHELFDEPDLRHWLGEALEGSVDTFYAADKRLRKWGL